MFKYRAGKLYYPTIERIEIQRETDSYVWVDGDRYAKRTIYESYFDSWDGAKAFLLDDAKGKTLLAQARLNDAIEYMTKVEDLEKPEPF